MSGWFRDTRPTRSYGQGQVSSIAHMCAALTANLAWVYPAMDWEVSPGVIRFCRIRDVGAFRTT
jgi:hypothetical protein